MAYNTNNSIADFNIRNFSKGKNYVIEASAGTGKTYTIVSIVEKLIEAGVPLEEMLILTYTEKAAGELKNRIREKLVEIDGKKGTNYADDIYKVTIGTIHSFCKSSIKEFCISSGKPSILSLIDENEVKRFIKRYLRSDGIYDEIVKIKTSNIDVEIEKQIEGMFNILIQKYYLDATYSEVKDIVSITSAEEWFPDVKDYSIEEAGKSFPDLIKHLETMRQSDDDNVRERIEVFIENDSINDSLGFNKRGKSQEIKDAIDGVNDIKNKVRCILNTKENDNDSIKNFVYRHIKDLYQRWQEKKKKNSQQTFNDMIRNVREEVENGGPLLDKLQEKYTYAIIDEFQDTNQKQWDILKKIFLIENHNIIVVGDPKQSIYAFQGADVYVYEKAKNEIINAGGELRSLRKNYRATENIIENTNIFFDCGIANPNPDSNSPFHESQCGNSSFEYKYEGQRLPAFWIQDLDNAYDDNEENDDNKKNKKDKNARAYYKMVCQTIIDCCSEDSKDSNKTKLRIADQKGEWRNVCFNDFTILARTRSEMEPMVRELENHGIPYIKYKDSSLFEGKESASWIAILSAIDANDFTGKNRAKFKKVLISDFFRLPLKEINTPGYDKDNIEEIKCFEKWRSIVSKRKWEDLIDSIISDTKIEEKMSSLNDIKTLGAIKQLGDYCIEYLSNTNSIKLLIENLKQKLDGKSGDDDSDEENAGIVAKGTDYTCVQIMTIHASKGLEFPVVISLAGFKDKDNRKTIYSYHDENGNNNLTLSKDIESDTRKKENVSEWKRLFYVAYTRAKYVLILPKPHRLKSSYAFVRESIDDFCLRHSDKVRTLSFDKNFGDPKSKVKEILDKNTNNSSTSKITDKEQSNNLKKFIIDSNNHRTRKYAYSSLSHGPKIEIIDENGVVVDNTEDFDEINLSEFDSNPVVVTCKYDGGSAPYELSPDFPSGATLGNALHEIFEKIDYIDPNADNDELIEECYKKQGIKHKDEWKADTNQMIKDVLQARLPLIEGGNETGKDFSLTDIGFENRRNEVEFNFNKENEKLKHFFNGFIDLIIKKGEYYCILDWKSDKLNDDFTSYSDGDQLKGHVDQLYAIQRVLYAFTLIKWLKNFYKDLNEQEIFEQHFGGVYYVFLRGCNAGTGNGIYAQTWKNYKELKSAYDNIVKTKVGN